LTFWFYIKLFQEGYLVPITGFKWISFKYRKYNLYSIIMICPQCGTENPADAAFCGKCGRNIASEQTQQSQQVVSEESKRFYRCSNDQTIAGVCSGLAKYLDADVSLVRVITVLSFLVSGSLTFWAYIICWLVAPEEPC
jgi:phage shock protein PspC (stress-responsive transcriptional regulator)